MAHTPCQWGKCIRGVAQYICVCIVFSCSCSTELGSGVVSTDIYCGTSNSPVAVQGLVMPVVITIEHSRIVRVSVTAMNCLIQGSIA